MKKQILLSAILAFFLCFGNAQNQKGINDLYQSIYCLGIGGSNIYAGTWDGGVFVSSNNGSNWAVTNSGLSYYYIYSLVISGSNVFAGTGRGVFLSTNNGGNWTPMNNGLPINAAVKSIVISGSNIFAGIRGSGVYLSTNNGNSWSAVNNGLFNNNVYSLAVSGSNIFAGTYGGGVYLSTDNGGSWTAVNAGLLGWGNYVNVLAINESNIFAGTTTGMFRSSNNGNSWVAVNNGWPVNTSIQSITFSGINIFAGTYYGEVYISSDNGNSWAAVNNGLPANTGVYALAESGTNIFAGTNNKGVYLSSNNGGNWVEVNTGLIKEISMANTISEMANWDKYPTYDVYESMMSKFQADFPNLFKRYDLVTLASGRKLIVGKITKNVNTKAAKPQFLYSSTMHGYEPTGFVSMLRFIDYLLTNYGTDAQVANIVDNIELWILPVSNPDGTYYGANTKVSGAIRYNSNYVDLNRNYTNPAVGAHPDGNPYQQETQTLMNFADSMNFVMGANFHSGHEAVYFPWDSWTSSRKHADDAWWRLVSKEFADTCQKYGPLNSLPNYFTEYPSGIIEGGDEKVLYGTRGDYMTYSKHCREFTVEVSYTYILGSNLLPNYWNSLYRSILHYPKECLNGIQGVITDSCTGKPIRAKVFVNNHDIDSSWVYSGSTFGNYYRPIKAGTWNLTYSAKGYKSRTIYNITSSDGSAVIKNVKLTQAKPDSSFSFSISGNAVTFASKSTNGISYLWNFGDGNTSTAKNPTYTFLTNGTFTVQLTVTNGCGISSTSQKIINLGVGINNQLVINNIEISPNPTNSFFIIKINSDKYENALISIFDINGSKIYENNEFLFTGSNQFKIDMRMQQQGVYIIHISTPLNTFLYKIIKKD